MTMGSFSVSTLLLRPLAGRWSDRYGRRRLLVGGAVAFALLALGHLVVQGVVGLVLLRVLLGAAEAVYFVAGFAALADLAPPGRAGEALSLNSLALYIGIAAGPLLGQVLLDQLGLRPRLDQRPSCCWPSRRCWRLACPRPSGAGGGGRRRPRHSCTPRPSCRDWGCSRASRRCRASWRSRCCTPGPSGSSVGAASCCCSAAPSWRAGSRSHGCPTGSAVRGSPRPHSRSPRSAWSAPGSGRTRPGCWWRPSSSAVGVAFVTPAVFAAVFSVVPASERGSAAATTSVFIDLGLGGGPMLTGALAAASSIPTAFVWVAALPLAGSLLLLTARPRPVPVVPAG